MKKFSILTKITQGGLQATIEGLQAENFESKNKYKFFVYFWIPPILQTVVPHLGHFPFAIFVPFVVKLSLGSFI